MNKDFGNMEELEYGVRLTMPLLTQEEINGIYININEITEQFTKMVIKDKDLAIAQYIMDKQQKMLEQKQFILDKVTKTLKRDREIFDKCRKKHEMYSPSEERMNTKYHYTEKLLNIIEGEKK